MNSCQTRAARIPELDGLRGVAILTILTYHYFILEGLAAQLDAMPWLRWLAVPIARFGHFGWIGVDLFFVLSGFLIGGILLESKGATNYFRVFYARRAYRILPAYLIVCVVAAAVALSAITGATPAHRWLYEDRLPWYAYLTFAQNFWMVHLGAAASRMIDATWSLAIEEQFYLALPFVLWLVRDDLIPGVLLGGILVAPLIRVLTFLTMPASLRGGAVYMLTYCRIDALLLGALGAWILKQPRGREWLVAHRTALGVASGALTLGVVAMAAAWWTFDTPMLAVVGFTWIAMAALSVLLIAVTQPDHAISRVLRLRCLGAVGGLAYALYLFHQPVLGLTHFALRGATPHLVDGRALVVTLLSVGFLFLAAQLSWILLERPMIRRGHAFQYSWALPPPREDRPHVTADAAVPDHA